MTTTSLPPLAKNTPEQDDLFDHLYEYGVSAEGVHSRLEKVCQAYATQARADLEAAIERKDALLRQALGALEYHTQQTRPITATDLVIAAIEQELSQ